MRCLAITGVSSIQACDEGALAFAKPARMRTPASFAQTADELASTSLPTGCTHPVEILVPSDSHRLRTLHWHAHRRTAPFPPGSLLDLGDGRVLASPAFFFLKVAPRLSFAHALLLGMELCGYYSTLMSAPYREYRNLLTKDRRIGLAEKPFPPSEWEMSFEHQQNLMDIGFVVRPPHLAADDLRSYVSGALAATSNSRALRAARYVMGDSRSPMESRLYARYCLPRKYGGLNLRPVQLNATLDIPPSYVQAGSIEKYSVDLCWPNAGIAIEYQGGFAHSGITAEQRDRVKRNILEATGMRIISIDKAQYDNEDMLELYAIEIAKRMGMYPSELKPQRNERAARYALAKDLDSWNVDLYRP